MMNVEVRSDSVFISGYVNAVERLSKPIREIRHGKVHTFLERIKAGAFHNALKRNDNVLVLLNHNHDRVLASPKEGTAKLEEDNIGLRAEITITDKEVVEKARNHKLSGWSFGFYSNSDEIETSGKDEIRIVTDLDLIEVSILDDTKEPAYYGTSIEAREGGARVMEYRADSRTDDASEENQDGATYIDLDKLAESVAEKVAGPIAETVTAKIAELLKPETMAKDDPEDNPDDEPEDDPKDNPDDEPEDDPEDNLDDDPEDEERDIDYSYFEERFNAINKA